MKRGNSEHISPNTMKLTYCNHAENKLDRKSDEQTSLAKNKWSVVFVWNNAKKTKHLDWPCNETWRIVNTAYGIIVNWWWSKWTVKATENFNSWQMSGHCEKVLVIIFSITREVDCNHTQGQRQVKRFIKYNPNFIKKLLERFWNELPLVFSIVIGSIPARNHLRPIRHRQWHLLIYNQAMKTIEHRFCSFSFYSNYVQVLRKG